MTLLKNGDLIVSKFVMGEDEPVSVSLLGNYPKIVKTVQKELIKRDEEIKTIPSELDNDSDDGAYQCFRFGQKTIRALNITTYDIEEMRKLHPTYDEPDFENMEYENKTIRIYEEIADIINEMLPEPQFATSKQCELLMQNASDESDSDDGARIDVKGE